MQTQATTADRYNNERNRLLTMRMHDEVKRCNAPKPISRDLTYDNDLVVLADRILTMDLDASKHVLALRRARRQHTQLHDAIIRGDLGAVQAYANEDNIDLATVNGLTPLHLAVAGLGMAQKRNEFKAQCKLVEEQIVDFLIAKGAPVEVWDSMTRLPAACIDGGKLPKTLIDAMDKLRATTAYKREFSGVGEEKERRTEFNAFFSEDDQYGDAISRRGLSSNKTGKGGNPQGITRIAGAKYNPAESALSCAG